MASRTATPERLLVPCCTMRLYFCAAATSCRPSKMLCEHGFSQYTSLPAWQAQMPMSECQWLGVAMEMASMDLSSSSLRTSVKAAGLFLPELSTSATRLLRTFSSTSQSAAISTFAIFEYSWMCEFPCPRMPTHATRTVSLMLGPPFSADAPAAAAVLIRKCLRFMVYGSERSDFNTCSAVTQKTNGLK